jgi:hypothetical protein
MGIMRRTLTGLAAAAAVFGASTALAQVQEQAPTARDLTVEQRPVYDLAPPNQSPLRIRAGVDHFFGHYRPGETVTLSVTSNQDAFITVVDIGTSGAVTVLFPNAVDRDNHIQAGQTLRLGRGSWKIVAGGPDGVEAIKVFASYSPRAIFSEGRYRPAGPFRAFGGDGTTAARDLAVGLAGVDEWTEASSIIRIVGAGDFVPPPPPPPSYPGGGDRAAASLLYNLPPSSAFGLRVSLDRHDGVYRPGEDLRVKVMTERPCRLLLMDVGTSGRINVLFPNRGHPEALIEPGERVILPSPDGALTYQVRGPGGLDEVVAVCMAGDRPFRPIDWTWGQEPFHELDGGREAVRRDLAAALDGGAGRIAYASALFDIER